MFTNDHPLTQLSLAIGDYEYSSLEAGGIEYGIWNIKGHKYFTNAFEEINDTISGIISERMSDLERTYNLEYAFKRLALVEVPAQLKTYERSWTSTQEYVQPRNNFV